MQFPGSAGLFRRLASPVPEILRISNNEAELYKKSMPAAFRKLRTTPVVIATHLGLRCISGAGARVVITGATLGVVITGAPLGIVITGATPEFLDSESHATHLNLIGSVRRAVGVN